MGGQTQLLPAHERLFPMETLAVCLLKGSVSGFFFSVKVIGIEFTIFPGYPLNVRIPGPDVISLALGIYSSLLLFFLIDLVMGRNGFKTISCDFIDRFAVFLLSGSDSSLFVS